VGKEIVVGETGKKTPRKFIVKRSNERAILGDPLPQKNRDPSQEMLLSMKKRILDDQKTALKREKEKGGMLKQALTKMSQKNGNQ